MPSHVAVLLGGWSNERPVSLVSGAACADALERLGHSVTRIDVDRDLPERIRIAQPDAVFNALHGLYGEDGTVQGLLEIMGIPYTHSGVLASALAMDKHQAKIVMKAAGVPVTDHKIVPRAEAAKSHAMKPPYVIKPIADGSSMGVFIVPGDREHPPQDLLAPEWTGGEDVMVERYIPGRELTCAVMGDVALGVCEIHTDLHFYNYEAKYLPGGSNHTFPAELSSNIYQTVQKLALQAHIALGCRGVSRVDFRFDEQPNGGGEIACLEVNTQPGMTETSLVPELAQLAGHSFDELIGWIVEDAGCNR